MALCRVGRLQWDLADLGRKANVQIRGGTPVFEGQSVMRIGESSLFLEASVVTGRTLFNYSGIQRQSHDFICRQFTVFSGEWVKCPQ